MSETEKNEKRTAKPTPVDEVTLDEEPARPIEVISLDIDEEGEETLDLDAETTLELLRQAQEEAYDDEIGEYTDDPAVQEALESRQDLDAGRDELIEELEEHHATSPSLSAGDLDARWDEADVGDETAGGTAATPDQDMVEEFGEAYGIRYEEDEPLHTEEKLAKRDQQRWELDPESAEED